MSNLGIIYNFGKTFHSVHSHKLGFPVSITNGGVYIAKVEKNRLKGEVWHPVDGRQIEKHLRDILKSED